MTAVSSTVFVIDDDLQYRTSLVRILRTHGLSARAFGSASEFLAGHERDAAGCLLLDLAMPGMDGLALQAALEAKGGAPPIVFLTGRGSIPAGVRAMKHGAVDFLTKPVDEAVLLDAVREALERYARRRSEEARETEFRHCWATLTAREREVAERVIAGRLNKQIAHELGIVQRTVKFHRSHVMEKLGVQSVAELAQLAGQTGVAAR